MIQQDDMTCPRCGQLDQTKKVTSLYSSGVSTVHYETISPLEWKDKTYYLPIQRDASSMTLLAQKLAPPSKPKLPGCAGISGLAAVSIIGFLGGSILTCQVIPDIARKAYKSSSSLTTSESILQWCVILTPVVLLVALWFWIAVKQTRILNSKLAIWQKAISKWEQLSYCSRCDGVFIPQQKGFIPINELGSFLYE